MNVIAGDKGGHMSPHFEKWRRQNYVFDPTLFWQELWKSWIFSKEAKDMVSVSKDIRAYFEANWLFCCQICKFDTSIPFRSTSKSLPLPSPTHTHTLSGPLLQLCEWVYVVIMSSEHFCKSYHGENKLLFDEMIIMSALFNEKANTLS